MTRRAPFFKSALDMLLLIFYIVFAIKCLKNKPLLNQIYNRKLIYSVFFTHSNLHRILFLGSLQSYLLLLLLLRLWQLCMLLNYQLLLLFLLLLILQSSLHLHHWQHYMLRLLRLLRLHHLCNRKRQTTNTLTTTTDNYQALSVAAV